MDQRNRVKGHQKGASQKRLLVIGGFVVLAITAIVVFWNDSKQGKTTVLIPISLQLGWKHGPDFAGFYIASDQGYYAEQGLDVTYLEGGPSSYPVKIVVDGGADFGLTTADNLIRARSEGVEVSAIACIFRRSPLVFASLEEGSIKHPRDFSGKTIQLAKQNLPLLYAITKRFGVERDEYTVVQTYDLEKFYSSEIDIWGGYITGSVLEAQRTERAIYILYPDNFGVHGYHQCIFGTDARLQASPEIFESFLRASFKGWKEMLERPVLANSLVAKFAPGRNTELDLESIRRTRPLVETGEGPIGWMNPKTWIEMSRILSDAGAIKQDLDPSETYTLKFLRKIYPEVE